MKYLALTALSGALLSVAAPVCAPALAAGGAPAAVDASAAPAPLPASAPLEVRMVVVTAFEIGADTGDMAGEYQAWADEMPQALPFPAGYRDVRYDPVRKILLLSTGIGTNRAAASTMALGLDPRFDLRKAYWLVAAIAGVNPDTASIGSAAWIGDVVDTDYGYLVDPREAPKDWPYGLFARGASGPYAGPLPQDKSFNLFETNHGLRNWAYGLTKHVTLPDTANLQAIRRGYAAYPAATRPPQVMTGDEATGQAFWHGAMLNRHSERWVAYWTGGKGRFVMTAMEDSGVLGSLRQLDKAGRADSRRAMILRTGSNYSLQPAGKTAVQSLMAESSDDALSGLKESLFAAHRVGRVVVDEITGHWATYRDTIPSATAEAADR